MYNAFNLHMLCQGHPKSSRGLTSHQIWGLLQSSFYQGSGNVIHREDICCLDMLSDHIGQWNTLQLSYKLEVVHDIFHCLCPIAFAYFEHLKLVCLFLLCFWLMLVFKNSSAAHTSNVIRFGALLYCLEYKCSMLEVFCHQFINLISLVRHSPSDKATRPSIYITDCNDIIVRLDIIPKESIHWTSTIFSISIWLYVSLKNVKDDDLTSNILFKNILMTRVTQIWLQVS